ncbi:MAG: hypothetical protein ACK4UN_20930, partial [Limisphaerales bacterium]
NYERKEKFRSSIWVRVGEPIVLKEWQDRIQEDERGAMRTLTNEIDQRLKQVVIHLDEERWEPFIGDLESLIPMAAENRRDSIAALRQRKRIADAVNYFIRSDRPRAESIAEEIKLHREKLHREGLSIQSDLFRLRYAKLFLRQSWDLVFLLIGLVPALLGTLYNLVPFLLVRLGSLLLPKQNRSTISLERLGLGLPIYGGWHAFLWFRLADYFLPWVATTWMILMLFSGAFALNYWPRAREMFHLWVCELKMVLRRRELGTLRQRHIELRKRLADIAEEYRRVRALEEPVKLIPAWRWVGARVAMWAACVALAVGAIHWTAQWIQHTQISVLRPGGLDFTRMNPATIDRYIAEDEKALSEVLVGLHELEQNALKLHAQLNRGERDFYSQRDNDEIRQLLFSYFSYRTELLQFIWKYQNYRSVRDSVQRARVFTLELAAASALYESSYKLVTHFA